MPFTDRFQLLDLKRDEGARTYEAREIATGRPVFVHLFSDSSLLAQIDALPADETRRILDRGEHEGGSYVVTDRLAEYPGLREWLQAKCSEPSKPLGARGAWQFKPPVAPLTNSGEQTLKMPAPQPSEPGEFTRLFAKPLLRPASPPPSPDPLAKEPGEFTQLFAAPVLRPPRQEAAPGEFTRQFQAPQRPAPQPPRAPVPPAADTPGEFTQMLQAKKPSPSPGNSSRSGEFTRYFESPVSPGQASPNIATPVPLRPVSRAGDAGEFTQIFGDDALPSAPTPPAPAAPPPASNNATQVFAAPRAIPRTPLNPPIGAAGHIPAGPGEYTQMFAKPSALTFGQPSAPQAPPLADPLLVARNNSRLPLLLVMGAVVLLMVAGIVYFMIRQHTT